MGGRFAGFGDDEREKIMARLSAYSYGGYSSGSYGGYSSGSYSSGSYGSYGGSNSGNSGSTSSSGIISALPGVASDIAGAVSQSNQAQTAQQIAQTQTAAQTATTADTNKTMMILGGLGLLAMVLSKRKR